MSPRIKMFVFDLVPIFYLNLLLPLLRSLLVLVK